MTWRQEALPDGGFPGQAKAHHLCMLAEHSVESEKRLVVVRFGKRVTVDVIERYARALRTNLLFRPDFAEIADLTEVEELDLQADDFLKLADEIDPFSAGAQRAFVGRSSRQKNPTR